MHVHVHLTHIKVPKEMKIFDMFNAPNDHGNSTETKSASRLKQELNRCFFSTEITRAIRSHTFKH